MLEILPRRPAVRSPGSPRIGTVPDVGGPTATTAAPRIAERPPRLGLAKLSFLALVLLPTLAPFGYLRFVATDEYVSEARFVVRAAADDPIRQLSTEILSLANVLGGPKSNSQDSHIVVGYVRGRTIIDDVGGKPLMMQIYGRRDVDWLSRLSREATFEDVWKHWRRKVSAVLDVPSGIVTVEARAFTREDALELAKRVVAQSEHLVNEISERARMDMLRQAQEELDRARRNVDERREALSSFRNSQEILDPMMSATSIGETATRLLMEKFRIENQIAVMQGARAVESPTLRTLRTQLASIDEQIRKLEAELAGNSQIQRALATKPAGYERLMLELKFAEKLYEIAEGAYKKAMLDAQRQQLYLVPVVQPTLPDEALYPRPVRESLLVFVWLATLWSVVALVVASAMEHR